MDSKPLSDDELHHKVCFTEFALVNLAPIVATAPAISKNLKLASKVVKFGSNPIILLPQSKSVKLTLSVINYIFVFTKNPNSFNSM